MLWVKPALLWGTGHTCMLSHVWLFTIPQTASWQAPLCMGFPRQEYWSGLSFPSPVDLPNPGIELASQGNDTPLQYSCLENPMVGGTWWAAVHGVAKSRTRQRFHFHFSLPCIGEGNGNPLQCSCLENPRDRVAWWAAVYGVAQSWIRLKRLSSSSCISYIGRWIPYHWATWEVLWCWDWESKPCFCSASCSLLASARKDAGRESRRDAILLICFHSVSFLSALS